MCLAGASGAGAALMSALPDPGLRACFVWIPMLPDDNRTTAEAASRRFAEPRAAHYWDGERHLAARFGRTLGISAKESLAVSGASGLAWDVYLAYGRGAKEIEAPDFWMHQLGVKHAPRLEPTEWRRRIEAMLGDGGV